MAENYIKIVNEGYPVAKIIFVVVAAVTVLLFLPLYYFVVWYERYGHDNKRTLINLLISFTCKVVMLYIAFGVTGGIVVSTFGPFPIWYCHVQLIFKHYPVLILILSIDCILVVRYVLIFWMKNPCIVHDDFWNTFLITWIIIFSGVLQIIYFFLPGRHPMELYFCIGEIPEEYHLLPNKARTMGIALLPASLVLGLCSTAHIKLLKRKLISIETALNKIEKHESNMLVRKAWYLYVIALLMITALIVNSLKKQLADTDRQWIFDSLVPFSVCSMWCIMFASRASMRKELLRETKNLFQFFNQNNHPNWNECQN